MEDFFLVRSGGQPIGGRASSSSSSAILEDYTWEKVRAEPYFYSITFWGGDPLSILDLLELLGRMGAYPFLESIEDRFRLDLARSRPHLVEKNFKHVSMM